MLCWISSCFLAPSSLNGYIVKSMYPAPLDKALEAQNQVKSTDMSQEGLRKLWNICPVARGEGRDHVKFRSPYPEKYRLGFTGLSSLDFLD